MSNTLRRNKALRLLGSMRLTILLLLLLGGAAGFATLVESRLGTPAAWELIYDTLWFEGVFVLMALNLLAMLLVRLPWRRRRAGFVLLHLGMIVIIVGAGLTRFGGMEGSMSIREGASANHMLTRNDYIRLSDGERAAFAEVRPYRTGPTGIVKKLTVGDETYRVALEEVFLHYAERLIEGEGGVPLLNFATVGEGGMVRRRIQAGETETAGGVSLDFKGVLPAADVAREEGPFLDLYYDDAGCVWGCAGFPLEVVSMGGDEAEEQIEPGRLFEIEDMTLYRHQRFSLVPIEFIPSAIRAAAATDDPTAPPALRVTVTDGAGHAAETVLVRRRDREIDLGGRSLRLAFGPRRVDLPYSLELVDFMLFTYPGSGTPSGYESHVRLHDPARGVEDRAVRIYMNHPLSYRGYKHFQSSYDPDRRGTILSVSLDPGRNVTYLGYLLLTAGLVIALITRLAAGGAKGGATC